MDAVGGLEFPPLHESLHMVAIAEVLVPDIGDFKDVPVIEVMVRPGDVVKPDDALITLESDKATIDIPAPFGGAVKRLKIKVGDKVSVGTPILELEASDGPIASVVMFELPASAQSSPETQAVPADLISPDRRAPEMVAESVDEHPGSPRHASPSVRRFARELGVGLDTVIGTGPQSRILKEDVQAFVRSALALPATGAAMSAAESGRGAMRAYPPRVDFARFGPIERQPLSRVTNDSRVNLQRSWSLIPHLSHFDEADITELNAFRDKAEEAAVKQGVQIPLLAFILKVSAAALKEYPIFNTSLEGEDVVLKRYYHVAFTLDTPIGVVVPVVRDVDQKGVLQIAKEIGDLSAFAREGNLKPEHLQGATFSVSRLDGLGFTPIINAPEVAILGVARSTRRLVEIEDQFVPRLMLPLSLSYDLRIIDAAAAAGFTGYLAALLGDLRRAAL